MRDIICINILAMYKSAKCTFFILSGGGLGSVSPGELLAWFLRSDGHLVTISEKVYDQSNWDRTKINKVTKRKYL